MPYRGALKKEEWNIRTVSGYRKKHGSEREAHSRTEIILLPMALEGEYLGVCCVRWGGGPVRTVDLDVPRTMKVIEMWALYMACSWPRGLVVILTTVEWCKLEGAEKQPPLAQGSGVVEAYL